MARNTRFLGLQYPLTETVRGIFAQKNGISQIKADMLQLLLTNPGERCITGDTKIPLANGMALPVSELVDRDPFWVYAFDSENNKIVPGRATASATRKNADLVKVTIDSGESIRCTPDHLWMMRDGTFVMAENLKTNDSLMPLYRNLNSSGHEMIYQPHLQSYQETHLCFVEGSRTPGIQEVAHHVGLDSDPGNVKWMDFEDRKVLSVDHLGLKEDCYDLSVEKYHNFAISSGVFLHNCMLPEFGTPLRKLIFEPNDPSLVVQARKMIQDSLAAWEPRVIISQVTVTDNTGSLTLNRRDNGTETDHILGIQIQFYDPQDISQVDQLTLELPIGGG